MISTIELKKHIASVSILDTIIGKLYHKKKSYLIIMLEIDKNSEIDFYCIILSLSLAIICQ